MKSYFYISFLSGLLIIASFYNAHSQDNKIDNCLNLINSGYISDGQEYKVKLDENNKARFYTTFYGGSYYRIVGCSNIDYTPLILSVYDTEKNLLFCNKDYNYIPYWNFKFNSTINCIIEIEFDKEKIIKDEVMLLIGFKEN